ncbi:Ig-like domain-containing protein [Shewanella maritima]|uniref:Ig-like domain-containing protein n=1 Tax=Shewanella maritima TaxID=2520507 RepID=UPI003734FC4B
MMNDIPYKKLVLASTITMLVACSSDNDNDVTPPPGDNTPPVADNSTRVTDANQSMIINPMLHVSDADESDVLTLVSATSDKGNVTLLDDNKILLDPEHQQGDIVISYTVTDGTDEASAEIVVTANKAIFAGTQRCLDCHGAGSPISDISSHQLHGHNFKISKIDNDETPSFPYSSVEGAIDKLLASSEGVDNSLGKPNSYADVSYTSGGYGWKYRWMDKDGYLVTGSEAQFNIHAENLGLDDQIMVNYNGGSVDKPYNCGHCHTTGWKPYSAELHDQKQDDLPGIHGSFFEAGVQCEACHGAGLAHSNSGNPDDIVRKATPRATASLQSESMGYGEPIHCAECHTRDGDRNVNNGYISSFNKAFPEGPEYGARVAVRSGLPRHHQGHDEFMRIDPDTGEIMSKKLQAGMTCSSCHDTHKSVLNQDQAEHIGAISTDCTTCHSDKVDLNAGHGPNGYFAKACIDCHMPDVVKNAVAYENEHGNKVADIRIHTFAIDLYNEKGQLQDSEAKDTYMYPYLQDGFACGECHEKGSKLDSLQNNYGGKMHQN